jgi:RHS repeat-associated protein
MTDALSGVVSLSYDAAGRATTVTNARGKSTTMTYDDAGQLLTRTDPLSRVSSMAYDLAGRVTSATDPRGVVVSYGYDDAGHRTSITASGGSVTYAYDDAGRRTSMVDASGTTSWVYDAASQLTSVTNAAGTVGYAYDDAGRRTALTYPGSRTVSYSYDNANRMTALTDWQSRTIAFDYNADGQRTGITRPNGVTTDYGYDLAGRLTSVTHDGGGLASALSYAYTLDAAGNRTAVTTGAGTESYTLDALNRLTNVTYANSDTAAYTYDANGNRLTQAVNGATVATYTYDDADQLTSDGTTSYAYDNAGNLTAAGSDSYSWDGQNRLSSATVSGTTETYAYDGDDVRISATTGGTTTTNVWDRASGLPLLLDDGTDAYLHAGGLQEQVDGSNADSYPLADSLGSVRGMTDGTGTLTATADYGAFGDVRSSTGAGSSFGYAGEQSDSVTGALYLRARDYQPTLGRFLSADSVQPNAPGTQGYNRYAYAANNPTTWTDPSGHTIDDIAEGVKVIHKIIDAIIILAGMLVALLPLVLLDPFLGFAVGLIFFIAFVKLGALLIQSVADVLALMTDAFDHYDGDAPEEDATDSDPDLATCSLTREELLNQVYADGQVDATERGMLTDCGVSAEQADTLTLLADWTSFLINVVEIGYVGLMTIAGCFGGIEFGLPLLGCAVGFEQGYVEGFVAGTAISVLIGLIPVIDRCIGGTKVYSDDCFYGGAQDALASRVSGPFFDLAWSFFAYCDDRGYIDMGRCYKELNQGGS